MRLEAKGLGAVIGAVVLAIGVAACGGGSTVNTSSASNAASAGSTGANAASAGSTGGGAATTAGASGPGAWTIGSLVDLTGTDANGGAAQQKGIKYLVDQLNASGGVSGHKLSVKFCDTQSTPGGAAQCAQQLAGVNTHVVLAQSIDPPTRGALPYLTKDVVVAVDPILLPKAGTNVFQASGASSVVAAAMVAGAKSSGFKTIGVLYTTDTSGTHQLAAAKAAAAKAGLKVVAQPQDAGSNDVTPQLVKLRAAGADVIYLASVGTNTAAAVNSYRTLGMSQPVIAGAAAVTNGFLHSLSSIPQHLYGVSQLLASPLGIPSSTAKAFTQYRDQFKAAEGEPADTQTTTAVYDGCVATSALKAAGTSVPGMVKFLKSQPIQCLGSTMRFNIPGINVVSGQPAALAAASTTASNGWGPVQGKL